MFSNHNKKRKATLVKMSIVYSMMFLLFLAFLVHDAYGQEMSSSNYGIQSDSVNFGGANSSSDSYSLEDTLGEVATGISTSTNYTMSAGFQQMNTAVLAVVPPGDVTMSPSIGGVSGGTSNGSTNFTVTTDDTAGYTAYIKAGTSPALASALDSFGDYTTAGNPDFAFNIPASASLFAFSPKGSDIFGRFMDNGSSCGTGSGQTIGSCWDGLTTTSKMIASRVSGNQPDGTVTTLNFRAASGASHIQTNGVYTATLTLTILPM